MAGVGVGLWKGVTVDTRGISRRLAIHSLRTIVGEDLDSPCENKAVAVVWLLLASLWAIHGDWRDESE